MRKASIIALVAAVICVGITGWKTYQIQIGERTLLEAVGYAHQDVRLKDWTGATGNVEAAFAAQESMKRAFRELCLWLDLTAASVLAALVTGLLALRIRPNQRPERNAGNKSGFQAEPAIRRGSPWTFGTNMSSPDNTINQMSLEFLRQDVSALKIENKQLWQSYVSASADYSALQGLIVKVARKSDMDVNETLDTLEQNKKERKKELLAFLKQSKPELFEGDGALSE